MYGVLEFAYLVWAIGYFGLDEERSLVSLGLYMGDELLIADTIQLDLLTLALATLCL